MTIPKILIAGQSSGIGKTTITLGIIAALCRRGLAVQSFKCGPDYIDPSYHTLASGRPCRNLDTWMLSPEQMAAGFERACQDADIAIIEGVMGLFDGSSYTEEIGSSAQIAKLVDAPILLVLDIGKMARTAGAMALGYQQFDPELNLAGFLLNRAGSARHAQGCMDAIQQSTGLPCVGWLGKEAGLHIPERHLGLIPTIEREEAGENPLERLVQAAADAIETHFDLDEILAIAGYGTQSIRATSPRGAWERVGELEDREKPRLAVARDEAFSFHYPDNLELLAEAGAELVFFSPLHDSHFPEDVDGLYLVGGFPEVYAQKLSQNGAFLEGIRQLYRANRPIYAECGGFMTLTEAVIDLEGQRWPMAGLIPGDTKMQTRLASLGYRVATATTDNLLMMSGEEVRGHEFHYSTWVVDESALNGHHAWQVRRRQADSESQLGGYCQGNLLASYIHVHFGQNTMLAEHFLKKLTQNQPEPTGINPSTQSVKSVF